MCRAHPERRLASSAGTLQKVVGQSLELPANKRESLIIHKLNQMSEDSGDSKTITMLRAAAI